MSLLLTSQSVKAIDKSTDSLPKKAMCAQIDEDLSNLESLINDYENYFEKYRSTKYCDYFNDSLSNLVGSYNSLIDIEVAICGKGDLHHLTNDHFCGFGEYEP